MLQVQAKEQAGDLVVVVSVDTATAVQTVEALQALQNLLAKQGSGALPAALTSAGLRMAPDSLRVLPPATQE